MSAHRLKASMPIIAALLRAKILRKGTPLFVSWAVTYRCNSRCAYCKIWDNENGELTTAQCVMVLDGLKKSGVRKLNFTGGEPLVREDMPVITEYCYQSGIPYILNTNGSLLPGRIDEFKHLCAVKLSLDGPAEIHDCIRGAGSFDGVLKSLEAAQRRNIKVVLETVLSKYNLGCIDYVINVAREFNVAVGFQPASLNLLGSREHNDSSPCVREYRESIKSLMARKNTSKGKYIYNSKTGLKHLYRWPDTSRKLACAGGLIFCRIEPDGDILLCARNSGQRFNCIESGLKQAFDKLKPSSCGSCWCTGVIEANYLFSLNPDVILNLMRVENVT